MKASISKIQALIKRKSIKKKEHLNVKLVRSGNRKALANQRTCSKKEVRLNKCNKLITNID